MTQSRAQTKSETKPGVVKLSDLAIEGREFDLKGTVYKTKNPMELSLPEIARIDKMGRKFKEDLPAFGKGDYEGIDLDQFAADLVSMVVAVSNVPENLAKELHWWQQILIIGLFQSVAGMDFLEKQLQQPGALPEGLQEKLKEQLKPKETTTSTSPTP